MKNFYKYILIVAILLLPVISFASEYRAGDQLSTGKDEIIPNDMYMAGSSITSAGEVEGDLVTGGGNIVISGNIGGDLMAGGGNVNILSDVGDDLRVGGGTVVLQGKVGGDMIVGGGQINIGGAGIGGDLIIGGGNVRIDAPIEGKLIIGGGNVYINAPVGGEVKIMADKVTLGGEALLSGNLTYKAKKELTKEDGAVVKGEINFSPIKEKRISKVASWVIFSSFFLWKFFALLASSLLLGLIFRRYGKEIVIFAIKRPFFELGRGFLVFVAMPIISMILLWTLVGIPIGIIGLLGFVIIMVFAWIITPIILGSFVRSYFLKRELEISWKTILLGVFIFCLLGLIPFIGCLAQFVLVLIALGSMLAFKLQIIKEWR